MADSLKDLFGAYGLDPDNLPEDAPRLPPEQVATVLRQIGDVLAQAPSYRALPPEDQARILENTRRIADALESPVQLAPGASSPPTAPGADPYAIRF